MHEEGEEAETPSLEEERPRRFHKNLMKRRKNNDSKIRAKSAVATPTPSPFTTVSPPTSTPTSSSPSKSPLTSPPAPPTFPIDAPTGSTTNLPSIVVGPGGAAPNLSPNAAILNRVPIAGSTATVLLLAAILL
ncbi:classical arabinogalactan protein 5-like [Olea europaea var. sylvestris]|uniref:classical arabinogalactan protein 5-like n=1 Tax=Olea europaea var. sylvestris TaxID=158386 RepID=UPI000C1D347E|nr:classical arabinogalactan protein 5-like [Olea europaea var. sylvestris]